MLVQYLYDKRGLDMSISGTSHGFMSTMIGFLLVTRVSMAYQRYLDLRGCLESMTRQTREMVQNMVLLTGPFQTTSDKEWRRETAAKTLVLLRAVMAVVDYGSERVPAWDVGGLTPTQRKDLLADLFQQSGPHCREKRWSRPPRTEMEESMRVPTILAQQLRACLGAGETRLSGKPDAYRFFNLYGAVDGFMESYYSLRRHMTTPFPFPMEQMNRTFLYFYIFTVPLTLLQDVSDDYPYMQLLVTVFLTYGFVGLQLIAIELDDPFGNDQVCATPNQRRLGLHGVVCVFHGISILPVLSHAYIFLPHPPLLFFAERLQQHRHGAGTCTTTAPPPPRWPITEAGIIPASLLKRGTYSRRSILSTIRSFPCFPCLSRLYSPPPLPVPRTRATTCT